MHCYYYYYTPSSYTWWCQWKQMMFYVKLAIHSIHLCIHHRLYPNTARDTGRMVSRLLHNALLLVAYYQPRIGHPPKKIFTQHVQTWVQREAGNLLYSFMHSPSPGSNYRERYGLNGLQATACSPGSIPTNNEQLTHNIHSTNANMYSAWSCWPALSIRAFCIACIQIRAEIWIK